MWDYTETVRDHFLNPRNAGTMEDANAVGEVGSLACGDALKLYLKIDADERITDAKFQTFGCASAIASSSALTEMLKGKTLEEAAKITNKDITAYLGGLPRQKMHCSVMGQEALEAALKNYRGEETAQPHHGEGKIICKCFGVTDELILRSIRDDKLTSIEEVTHFTKAGGGCADCHDSIQRLLDQQTGTISSASSPKTTERKLSNVQRMQLVLKTLEEEIRPALQKDGGDIELLDIDGTEVIVALRGMCSHCPSSQLTLTNFVQRTLQEHVEPAITVREGS